MAVTDLVPIPAGINAGVKNARQTTMLALLGSPRHQYDDGCQEVTNAKLRALIVVQTVGPLKVTGLRPAVQSLARVLGEIGTEHPDVHAALGHAGMLCARLVRGSSHSISNHSWGTTIDLRLGGILDRRGDGRVQKGLALIAPIFNRHGWFWGAGFSTEDAMHFEAGDDLVREWARDAGTATDGTPPMLVLGDRGPGVEAVQRRLQQLGASLKIDGIFGPATRAAVVAFQAANGIVPSGTVGPQTLAALGLS